MRPAVNLKKSEELVELFVALPGVSKKDININVENGLLTITTDEKETEDNYLRRGFDYSGLEWKFQIPSKTNTEDINAELNDGVLAITMPQVIFKKQIKVA